jgi:uncharacterized protein YprB with RNaseH-like and TPR domain
LTEAADRAATIAELRRRLARLGGLARATPRLAPAGEAPPPATSPGAPEQPEFRAERVADGTAWVRRVSIDLGPFLERAGAPAPAGAGQLLHLAYAPGDPSWGEGLPSARDSDGAVAVLDIETLGLRGSGVLAFLVGIGVPHGSRLHVDQLLLRDPGDEAAMLTAVLARLSTPWLLVTYNGRTFDLPVLRSRCIVNRLGIAPLEGRMHCDLLAPVRRLFRDRLGACTLRHAEVLLLGMEREGDAPGYEAPARYRAWLSGRAPDALEPVVLHNQLDLCATMVLAARLAAHVEGRLVEPVHPADRYHLGAHLERRGVEDTAEVHYRAALAAAAGPWDAHAGHRLARRLRRGRDPGGAAEAMAIWSELWRRQPHDLRAARSLAVSLERAGALGEAIAICERCLRLCAEIGEWRLSRLRGAPRGGWHAEWLRRRSRLAARIARACARSASNDDPVLGEVSPAAPQSPPPTLLLGADAGGAATEVLAY